MPCCAVLCCAVLCCAVLCCAELSWQLRLSWQPRFCCAVLGVLCGVVLHALCLLQHVECMACRFRAMHLPSAVHVHVLSSQSYACVITKDPAVKVLAVLADGRMCARSVGTTKATREQPRCLGTALAVALQLLAAGNQGGGRADSYGSDSLPLPQTCRPSRVLLITTGPATKV